MKTGCRLFVLILMSSQLLLGATSHGQSHSGNETIDYIFQRQSLKAAFAIIQQQTDYLFIYNEQLVAPYQSVALHARQKTVAWTVNELLRNTRLTYKIQNKKIIILEKETVVTTAPTHTAVVAEKVKGKVTDEKGMPLPGVTVVVKNTNRGGITDSEGIFFTAAAVGDILVFSMSGYTRREITVTAGELPTVILQEDVKGLEEIVVVGYGTQKKRDITGSISSVKGSEIAAQPTTNAAQALKGKVAGLDVFSSGNEPGAGANILLRGQRSIKNDNSPLIVLDGIPMVGGFNEINPNDIASIEVLKDASSTAIYGSRAANGVLIITTKRGKAGKTNVAYDAYYGVTSITRKLDLMNGEQFAQLRREAARTADPGNNYPADTKLFDDIALQSLAMGRSTDWQDLIYHNGAKQNHQLSLTGGKEKTQFAVSFNYFKEKGIVDKTDFTRGALRINLDHQINTRIRMGVSTLVSKSTQNVTDNTVFDNALRLNPLGIPYDSTGKMLFRPNNDEGQRVNPLSVIKNTINQRYKTRVFASMYGEWDIYKDLTYRLNIGPEIETSKEGYFKGSETDDNQGGNATAGLSNADMFSITIENILKYTKQLSKSQRLGVTLLQSSQQQTLNSSGIRANKLPYEAQSYHNLETAGEVTGISSDYRKSLLLSYMVRVNYDYKNRYLFTITGRADGSSVFAAGHKWGYFPSAAIAWRMDAEPFMQSLHNINTLKLRLSYGSTGFNGILPYGTFSTLKKSSYAFGETGMNGFQPATIANPNLRWESTASLNAGIDFGLFNNRITGTIEHYIANTKNILLRRSIPGSTGYTEVLENIGATRNKGWEVTLSTVNIDNKDFQWTTDLNFSTNRNEIVQLYGDGKDDIGNQWFIGQPIKVFYDYQKTGIWQTNEAEAAKVYGAKPGQIKLQDTNNDKKYSDQDRVILGSEFPGWIGGMTNHFSYKGLELNIVINTRQQQLIYSRWYENNNRLAGRYNNLNVDYWTPENPTNEHPRPDKNQESVYLGSTLAYKDASFVRVKNLSLAYSLPQLWLQRAAIKTLKITLSAENPFTITGYKGQDPEFESDGTRAMYPTVKMYAIGINAAF
ncbi:TonB-dependent receptor [Chitinophaga nivalis]|uniref:TonB-dependent receptor n=1 Tax=Chitinophaga nivalis TaxID=2991709 RepID=A0ABT3IIC6_9BACT|nr:TonB-dependent receptor [Chitinophaga nivalis]MCW3466620.1 TonB-dependent receptor [Chitinophaga nivalis]MCW3483689.1 TonB-dependent receptor [Chitinophaga nivalis]